ncbi:MULTISPECIES: hypothetical protein [unclassified Lentimicrobium]|uniref:hypothetical protein n=1 Tax=unclassified Lentimicrobium TaxID=2677434 RepID=UPI0015544A66|nr:MULTISPECIES: hypothetical protein [unclassified Lentimicrobium]NPD47665.1 hypothetical protein [Lentimicrobium sp. S6]NPD86619.1 hypothetical protein [Lentimicrobium sp. L6]
MKKIFLILMLPAFLLLSSMSGCEKDEGDEPVVTNSILHVEFANDENSEVSITIVEMRPHGNAGEADAGPIGDWTGNILPTGTVLAPGQSVNMDLSIPNLYWNEYRLGILLDDGTTIMLHEQEGWNNETGPPITHWGSDSRRVNVTVQYHEESGNYYIRGWGDWAV